MVRAMCGVQLGHRKKANDLTLGLNETMDQLAMANSVHWYDNVLRREDGHVLKMALDFKFERKKCRLRRAWRMQKKVKVCVV